MSPLLCRLRTAARHLPWASLLVAVVTVTLLSSPAASQSLQYDRGAIASGELWRMLTCHLTHCSFDHLVWDVGVLLVLGALCEVTSRRRWLASVALSGLAIPTAIWLLMPQLQTYRGLSGIDSALFLLLGGRLLQESFKSGQHVRIWATATALMGFALKTLYELTADQTIFVDSAAAEMIPVPLAHIVGGAAGLVAAFALPTERSPRSDVARRITGHRRGAPAPVAHGVIR